MKNKKTILIIILIVVITLIGGAYLYVTEKPSETQKTENTATTETTPNDQDDVNQNNMNFDQNPFANMMDNENIENIDNFFMAFEAQLKDVTTGEVRGIKTNQNTTGTANVLATEERYALSAFMQNLPDPIGDDFYEGWLVRPEPFDFISTGTAIKSEVVEGEYINTFSINVPEKDYTDYTKYVLTLEPNDGDPAPADHIVEGDFVRVSE